MSLFNGGRDWPWVIGLLLASVLVAIIIMVLMR
jgi:uncharacterized integral membrane protein